MKIITDTTTKAELARMASEQFGDVIKAVVDVEQGVMSVGGELHADMEEQLVQKKHSKSSDLWGINLYPEEQGDAFVEFDSMINLKPSLGNRTRGVESEEIQGRIRDIVNRVVTE